MKHIVLTAFGRKLKSDPIAVPSASYLSEYKLPIWRTFAAWRSGGIDPAEPSTSSVARFVPSGHYTHIGSIECAEYELVEETK